MIYSIQWRRDYIYPGGSDDKESAYDAGDQGSIPGLGRSPGGGNDYPKEYLFIGCAGS